MPMIHSKEKMCGKCYGIFDELFEAKCKEKPELIPSTVPLGMYHCPECGAMLVAGFQHPTVCKGCNDE